jgi:hypothetical protein
MGSSISQNEYTIKNVDLQVDTWRLIAGVRTKGERKITIPKLPDNCICNSSWNTKLEGCPDIIIESRIGSDSMAAEVYKLDIKGELVAGKIMPITNFKSQEENKNEIKLAISASNLVVKGLSNFFPIVYGSSRCNDTIYSDDSKYIESSMEYGLKSLISELVPSKKRFMALTRTKTLEETVEFTKSNHPDVKIPEKIPIKSDVLLSELAWGDLGSFVEYTRGEMSINMWDILIGQIWLAIWDLHRLLNINHNDLHQGNILIMMTSSGVITPLIHDFGKSSEVFRWTKINRQDDPTFITYSLQKMKPPKYILEKLYIVERIIRQHDSHTPLLPKIIEFWK